MAPFNFLSQSHVCQYSLFYGMSSGGNFAMLQAFASGADVANLIKLPGTLFNNDTLFAIIELYILN